MNLQKQIVLLFLLTGFIIKHAAAQEMPAAGSTANTVASPGHLKKIPLAYKTEAMAALAHFPELKNVPIEFRLRKCDCTLKTKPSFLSMFRSKGHRKYIVIISNKTKKSIEPITLNNLPGQAKTGVIGHELSHVVDFSKKSFWQSLVCLAGHTSATYLDRFEFHTDEICIEHGLGEQLEAWSAYVRTTMHSSNWRGAKYAKRKQSSTERYMNPQTIEKYMTQTATKNTDSQ
ncbi:MAG: hypothetical protein GXC73_03625 [Chitinophagaceae bacterium]|nr:hypothetical protein [Chitinophagaceae bacterium]